MDTQPFGQRNQQRRKGLDDVLGQLYQSRRPDGLPLLPPLFGPLGEVLHIRPVEPTHLALISITAFAVPIGTCELHKLLSRRQARG